MMRERWQRLQHRERLLITVAGTMIAALLIWVLIWAPVQQSSEHHRARIVEQQSLLLWLQSIAPEVRRLQAERVRTSGSSNRSPIGLIDQTARNAGLAGALQRIEPAADHQVRVMFEQVEFATLMSWLNALTADQPYRIQQFDAQRGLSSGRVDVLLVIQTGPR